MNPRATTDDSSTDPTTVTWPPERFFWAIIEPSSIGSIAWKRDGQVPPGLLNDLADQVPVDIDELHAVVAAEDCDGGRIIICAARRAEIERIHTAGSARRLVPASLPPGFAPPSDAGTHLDPDRLNLLIGAFEPVATRRARARRHGRAAAAVLALSALVSLGLFRRARHDEQLAIQAQRDSSAMLAQLGFTDDIGPGRLGLEAELDQRRRLAGVDVNQRRAPDAAAALTQVLGCWPADTSAKPQSLSLGPDGATLSVLVPPPGDAAKFIASLQPVEGWTLDEPRLASVGPETRITLRLRSVSTSGGRR